MDQKKPKRTDFPDVLREEYRVAIEAILNHLVKKKHLTRGAIANRIKKSQDIISKVSRETKNRGRLDYLETLTKLLNTYHEELMISNMKLFIMGTQYESIVDCKAVVNHLNNLEHLSQVNRLESSVQYNDQQSVLSKSSTYLLTYWWLREELFSCVIINTRTDSNSFWTELKFYKVGDKSVGFRITPQLYSQEGPGEIFNSTTSISTKGKGVRDSPNIYRTSFNLKIEKDQWDRLDAGMLIAGTYSTVSRQGKDEPISGLLIAEYLTSLDEVERKSHLLALFNANRLNTADPEHRKLTLIRQLLFREQSKVHKYHQLRHPFSIGDFEDPIIATKKRNDLFYIQELLKFTGKYIITYVNAHGQDPLVEEAVLEIFPNGSSRLTLPQIPLRDDNELVSQFSLIGKGKLLLGPFAFSRLKHAKIQFIINSEPLDNGCLYGVYAGVGQNNNQPAIGRVRMAPENSRQNKLAPIQPGYYKFYQLREKDPDFFDLITGKKEIEGVLDIFGESQYLLDKYLPTDVNHHQREVSAEPSNEDQFPINFKIYQDFNGVFELYSLSSHDSPSHLQVFPLYINSHKNRVEIKSRGNTYFGKLRYFGSGVIEMHFDIDSSGQPHFMHKLFIVRKTKMTDYIKPERFYGISTRINRNQALRASHDILLASTREWKDREFKFVENALTDPHYKANAENIMTFLKKNNSLLTVNYPPDHPLRIK